MYYSSIGLLAIFILCIDNYSILLKLNSRADFLFSKMFRKFLISVLVYYTTDVLWGILEAQKLAVLLFADTLIYFVAMAASIFYWTQFVVTYLNAKNVFGTILIYVGRIFFSAVAILVTVNIFTPVLFWVDEQCVYKANTARYVLLIMQILFLISTSIYSFHTTAKRRGVARRRYFAVAFFGIIMATFLTIQLWFPYLPIYTIAYMLGLCLLNTFVVNDEKEEYKNELENALEREKRQYEELVSTRVMAYKDALTGIKNKLAYMEFENQKDAEIKEDIASEFAVAIFDVNGLKETNDNLGHNAGDRLIVLSAKIICDYFKNSPVYRIGGDEFLVFVEKTDYQNRYELMNDFNSMMDYPQYVKEHVTISAGISDYIPGKDKSVHDVFARADQIMYRRKNELKRRVNSGS